MTLRAVIFDLFDTLVYFQPTEARAEGIRLAATAGIPEERWIAGWRSTSDPALRGEIASLEERMRRSLIAAGLADPQDGLVNALAKSRIRQVEAALLYPDVKDSLTQLRQQRFRLALVSNIYPYEAQIVDQSGLRGLLDEVVLSCELGVCKPNPEIYLTAVKRLSVEPAECVFVGDGAYDELSGARAVGMKAIRIERGNRDSDDRDEVCDARVKTLPEFLAWLPHVN